MAHHTHVFPMLVLLAPPDDATCMNSVLNTFFQTRVSGKEEKRRIQERISAERTKNESPTQDLLTVEQMFENDNPIPSCFADVSQSHKMDGGSSSPADAEDPHTVYTID
jgi:hypothetical protein